MTFGRLPTFYRRFRFRIAMAAGIVVLAAIIVGASINQWWLVLAFAVLEIGIVAVNLRAFRIFVQIGLSLHALKNGDYVTGEALLRKSLPQAEALAADDPLRGAVYHHLAEISRLTGNYTEAESFGVKALEVAEKVHGEDHVQTLDAILGLAQSYLDIARYPQAKRLLDRAMNALSAGQGTLVSQQAHCLAELGRWWSEQGFFAEAESNYRRATELLQVVGGANLGLSIRLSLAIVLAKLKRLDEAEGLIHAGLDQESKTGRAESMPLAMCLDQLAFVRLLQGRATEAEALQRRALALTEKLVGPNTPALSPGLALLGGILKVQRKWQEADECYRNALRLREEYSAPEHPALAEILEEYAELLELMGRTEEAQFHQHRAHQIRDFQAAARIA